MSGLTIWLPNSAVTAYKCELCEAEFTEAEKPSYERHVVKCAKKNYDTIERLSGERKAKRDADPFQGPFDPEFAEWTRQRYGPPAQRR